MKENESLKLYMLSDIKNLKVHGRVAGSLSPLTLFWTGSGIELNVKGSELWIEVEVDYDMYEPWISVLVDSALVSRQILIAGRYWVCIFRNMDENDVKNLRIVREVQAMNGDPDCSLKIHAIKFNGEFLPVSEKPYRIEFIGDSITSGEGTVGAKKEQEWIPMWFSAINNYTYMTAEALNADYRVISQSGWGVLTSWDNNPHYNIPEYYDKVCGLLTGEKNKALGAFEQNDFSAWQPDVVVVNLGTNDAEAFNSPEWKDEVTGETHKQRLSEDGTYNDKDLKAFEDAIKAFLIKLREYNKKAHIVWVYGMLGIPVMPSIYRAIDNFINETGDNKITVFQLPNTTEETVGSRCHPGVLAHRKAAEELSEYLREILAK
ncbi:SGNH/GDSL hydrolase family protein [Clostridium hydrogenum]|uniref:SGNH/GDSL hydrolase family protein n=1 Tax=Clostridium hydrogenum TaxID=2855764 RepID=UPI001F2A4C9A|nr:SGNH/GDSL hydrolase family protein [Clostridium hydrogenum]